MPKLSKVQRSILILIGMIILVAILAMLHRRNSMTLADYEKLQQQTETEEISATP